MGVLIRQDQAYSSWIQAWQWMHVVTNQPPALKTRGKAEKSRNLLKLLSLKHLNNLALSIINLLDYFRNNNKRGLMAQLSLSRHRR